MKTIRTIHKLRAVFFITILLSIFYACEEDTGNGEIPANLSIFDEWATDNEASNLAEITSGTLISTREELEQMDADGEYHLTADIDLGTGRWTPLFSSDNPFTGTVHGNGYIIYNLNINAPDDDYQGLFAALSGATIKNLGIGVRALHANAVAGALAGHAQNGADTLTLENIVVGGVVPNSQITVDGTVDVGAGATAYSHAGAVLGTLESGDVSMLINEGLAVMATGTTNNHGSIGGVVGYNIGNISNSRSSGMVNANAGRYVGGLVGYNGSTGTVHGSASGDVSTQTGSDVGGLVGQNVGTVRGFASGDVSTQSGSYVGGLVGGSFGGTIYGSANGDVSTDSGNNVGGLVGYNGGAVHEGVVRGSVVRGSASGDVSTRYGQSIGGLVGYNVLNGDVRGAASGTVSALRGYVIGGLIGGTGVDTVEGYSIGWVMVTEADTTQGNAQSFIGAVAGEVSRDSGLNPLALNRVYYHSGGGDHVGSSGTAPANDAGTRDTNGIGTGIDDIAKATATNMPNLTTGTAEGEWTFTAGEWPKINLPADVTDYMDYTTSPAQPAGFVD